MASLLPATCSYGSLLLPLLLLVLALGFTNEHFHVARAELERRHTVDVRSLLPNDVCSSIQGPILIFLIV